VYCFIIDCVFATGLTQYIPHALMALCSQFVLKVLLNISHPTNLTITPIHMNRLQWVTMMRLVSRCLRYVS